MKEDFLRQLTENGTDCQSDAHDHGHGHTVDAAVMCRDCNKRLCRDCDRSIHEPATMRAHQRTPFNATK